MDRRRRGGGGRRGGSSKRRVFTKLLKDKEATVADRYQARRFLEGMETFDSKNELLAKLSDKRDLGFQRIRDVLTFIQSEQDVEDLLIPLLNHVINDETDRPLCRTLRSTVLLEICWVPGLLGALVDVIDEMSPSSAACLGRFLFEVTRASVEARESDLIQELANALESRNDVDVRPLCAMVLTSIQPTVPQGVVHESSYLPRPVACWVTDKVPPGGRHDNDKSLFRNIQIVPTAEELKCTTKPYLPLASDENQVVEDPVTRLLDRNFRLLREDAVCTMKTSLQEGKRWYNARIIGLDWDGMKKRGALSFIIKCDGQGNAHWKRMLMHGSVVALCNTDGTPVRMGTISVHEEDVTGEWLKAPGGPQIGVVFESLDDFHASLHELLCNGSIHERMSQLKTNGGEERLPAEMDILMKQMITYDLVEVSKSFFAYQPILRTLQSMVSLPLVEELVFGRSSGALPSYIPNRLVLPGNEFFDDFEVHLDNWSSRDILAKTSLDQSQVEALHHTLTSKVSLIQGPPGCGKTFMGALIARTIRRNTDESILCLCYTNHALDQFLEHMYDSGERRIVRIGARSKSKKLDGYQLRALARHRSQDSPDGSRRLRQVDAQLHSLREEIETAIDTLKTPVSWTSPFGGIERFLADFHGDKYNFLRVPSQLDGFTVIGSGGKSVQENYLWKQWSTGKRFPAWMHSEYQDSEDFQHFWRLPREERAGMIEKWRREIIEDESQGLVATVTEFNQLNQEKKELLQEKDEEILHSARVIGATTTGAANFRDILSSKGAGVVIVEEAGEVLEAHVLTALNEVGTKHLILIGDHKQLRPKVETHSLTTVSGAGYNLDCSLFERLVTSGDLPSVSLEVQHRMRPSISCLIKNQTYPFLRDHETVSLYPKVKGCSRDVVFIDHKHPEDAFHGDHSTTKSNTFEAEMCVEIVRLLLLQGYDPRQIVLLTPYLGQLWKILQLVKSRLKEVTSYVGELDSQELEDIGQDNPGIDVSESSGDKSVRCSSVDNFQGEESDIIVISLVRSNKQGNIGFLKEEQRVNVLLSRARHGMFIVGNSATLCQQSSSGRNVWPSILQMMAESGQVLGGLPSVCQLHPDDEPVLLCEPAHFRGYRPNGGCNRPCSYRLPCGHVCPKLCHPIDKDHLIARKECCEPCKRFPPECKLEHICRKLCKDECGECEENVGPQLLECGHIIENVRCHDARSPEALKRLSSRCQSKIRHTFDGCGHSVLTTCANARSSSPTCSSLCNEKLSCGHPCQLRCHDCNGKHDCKMTCERTLFCGHICGLPCHPRGQCKPCEKRCGVRCSHSKCFEKCSELCSSCMEACIWACEHQGQCGLVCGAPCNRLPCNKRCPKLLDCGHQCPSVCGEECPASRFCIQCGPTNIKNQIVDMICLSSYEDHDVDSDPLIFLRCGHFYCISTLDGHLGLGQVYDINKNTGVVTGLQLLSKANVSEKPRVCPECRDVISHIYRYGRLLKLAEVRSLERKHLMLVDQALDALSLKPADHEAIATAESLQKCIMDSPMRRIYEACGGSAALDEVPLPPSKPLIRCLEIRGSLSAQKIRAEGDEYHVSSKQFYEAAFDISRSSESIRSALLLKISLAQLAIKWPQSDRKSWTKEVEQHLDWVIDHGMSFEELVQKAMDLKDAVSDEVGLASIRQVVSAMSVIRGYNYGGSPDSHWFECPNGHPYFIGECGGAMETSRCIECGAEVGGGSHQLLSSNRQVGGVVRDVLQGRS